MGHYYDSNPDFKKTTKSLDNKIHDLFYDTLHSFGDDRISYHSFLILIFSKILDLRHDESSVISELPTKFDIEKFERDIHLLRFNRISSLFTNIDESTDHVKNNSAEFFLRDNVILLLESLRNSSESDTMRYTIFSDFLELMRKNFSEFLTVCAESGNQVARLEQNMLKESKELYEDYLFNFMNYQRK